MKIFTVISYLLLLQSSIFAQSEEQILRYKPVDEFIAMRGVRQMYNFQFDESKKSFEEFTLLNPEHPSGYFYLVVLEWFTLRMVEEDKEIWSRMLDGLDNVIEIAEARLKKHPDDALTMVYLGASRGLKARVALSKNNLLDTFYDAQAGFSIINDAMEVNPTMIDPLIGVGVFHYFIAISGSFVRSIAYMAGLSSSREDALNDLNYVAEKGMYAAIEARSFLMFAYAYIEEDYEKALGFARGLVKEFDENPYFRGKLADILLMNGMLDEADEHIDMMLPLSDGMPQKYLEEIENRVAYLKGEKLRREGKLEEAIIIFTGLAKTYTLEFKFGLAYIYLRAGMTYDQLGARKKAVKQYKKAVKLDNFTSAVSLSKKYLKNAYSKTDDQR